MHSFTHIHKKSGAESAPQRRGIVALSARWYDLLVQWFVMHGKEQEFRRMTADLAQLQPGESVLDVGCGTGTLSFLFPRAFLTARQGCYLQHSMSIPWM